jgi:predicted AlkP superfamily phosphohydrolase/phosphomutase
MRILVISLVGATPDLLFGDERLSNMRRLMEIGCYGRLQDVMTQPDEWAWERAPAVRDQIASSGRRVIVVSASPLPSPRPLSGVWVSCRPGAHASLEIAAYPKDVRAELLGLIEEHQPEVSSHSCEGRQGPQEGIYTASRARFAIVRYLMQKYGWDYFECDVIGLESMRRQRDRDQSILQEYCGYLDQELGNILELVDDDTAILVASSPGSHDGSAAFIFAAAGSPLQGEVVDASLLDIAPTLLALGGYDIPTTMQGRSLLAGQTLDRRTETAYSPDEEELVRRRLEGLGYIE